MSRVLVIGAGGVGGVVAHKCAQLPEVFSEICLASRTPSKCESIAERIARPVLTTVIDADRVAAVEALIDEFKPSVLINVASPYQNLSIMEACAKKAVHYVDTSMDDIPEEVKYDYANQWAFDDAFRQAGVTGLLSLGFDPGVVNVFCAYTLKHHLDRIDTIDIIDCNAGDHGLPFATNFDPETNIREILAPALFFEEGEWKQARALEVERTFDFPEIGPRRAHLMAHEELLSLAKFIPGVRNVRFWMTFSDEYLAHLRVLNNVGMTRIDPVSYEGSEIVPLRFLKQLLPDPASLGPRTKGKTCIATVCEGLKEGRREQVAIYNTCVHEACFAEVGSQAISYTTGVPAVLGARLVLSGAWCQAGVYNPEQLDPDPFMEAIGEMGLPWRVETRS